MPPTKERRRAGTLFGGGSYWATCRVTREASDSSAGRPVRSSTVIAVAVLALFLRYGVSANTYEHFDAGNLTSGEAR